MMPALYIAFALVLLAAAIDALRIRWRWAATGNIEHGISCSVGAALAASQWFIQHPHWHLSLFVIMCGAMRLAFYDPALNLMRREPLDYVSVKTSSLVNQTENRWKIPFWVERALAGAILIIVIIIQKLL